MDSDIAYDIASTFTCATSRSMCSFCPVTSTKDVWASNGTPLDLLHRILSLRTMKYTAEEMVQITHIRTET
jgi:DNA helicase TIP49 (TBP-interacting protein)